MNREILRLAIPNIVSNISVPLLSSVDTILMGHLSPAHLAALGVAAMIFTFLYGNFNFLRMGTTGMSAQAYGRGDSRALTYTLLRALLLAFFLGLLLVLFQKPLIDAGIYLMNVDDSYEAMVRSYFDIRIYTAPAIFMIYALMGWYFGLQNAWYPLWITVFINIVNLVLSLYFVQVLGMGVEGTAYGTLIAQYAGLLLAVGLLYRYRSRFVHVAWREIFHKEAFFAFLHINKNIFIRTVALTFVLAFFYAQAAKAGALMLSVMILLLQFMIWMSFAIDGFANAAESLTGRYYGAKEWRLFDKAVRYSFYWGGGFALLFALVYCVGGRTILEVYTNQQPVIERAMAFMKWVALMPLLSFGAFIWDGVFVGMTASKSMRDAVMISMLLFLGLFYATNGINFAWSLWLSFLMFFLFRTLLQTWMFVKHGRRLR
ncbi:MAG: MATE family efflux transporter [Sulfurospirillum sp.]|nr:MAG: MATE family efflux transporter [Sulfurospirillum sp.]